MPSCATKRGISVTGFGTTEFVSEEAGRREIEIFEIMDVVPEKLGKKNVHWESP